MNIKMNFIESIFHNLECGKNPESLNGTFGVISLSCDDEPRGKTVRVYDDQYGRNRSICTIIKTVTIRPYLHLIHESNGIIEKYSFSMGFNVDHKRTDNSIKYHLFENGESLVLKQTDAEKHIITDVYAEDAMFQFSTVYNADHKKMILLDKVHKQLSSMELNSNYIFTGNVNALEHFFKE